ncbi:MAG: hypothetical protein AAF196_11795, partial [Planctomycetota bacterium]
AGGRFPDEIEVVQSRLIRSVGRVRGPDGRFVYLKAMTFPRLKDRIRYLFRALPGRHEARMLEVLRQRAGEELPGPRPLGVVARRRGVWPAVSVLALEGLDVADPSEVTFDEAVRVAEKLASIGFEHPDLHSGNLLRLRDGRVAVLDFQSAQTVSGPLGEAARARLATKLWQGVWPEADPEALVQHGLIGTSVLPKVMEGASVEQRRNLERRILRCLRTSTEFQRRRGPFFSEHTRRGVPGPVERVVPTQVSARELWLGDRVRELVDGVSPLLAGARLGLGPGSRRGALYIAGGGAASEFAVVEASLSEAYRRCFDSGGRLRSAADLRSAGIDFGAIL